MQEGECRATFSVGLPFFLKQSRAKSLLLRKFHGRRRTSGVAIVLGLMLSPRQLLHPAPPRQDKTAWDPFHSTHYKKLTAATQARTDPGLLEDDSPTKVISGWLMSHSLSTAKSGGALHIAVRLMSSCAFSWMWRHHCKSTRSLSELHHS